MKPITWIWISCTYFTGAFDTDGDKIISAPPIARWTIGMDFHKVLEYFHNKNQLIDWKIFWNGE